MLLGLDVCAVVIPLEHVLALAAVDLLEALPIAPLSGAVKVTLAPLTGLPQKSFTVVCSAVANAVLMVVLCVVPAVAVTLVGEPGFVPVTVKMPAALVAV